MAERVISLFKIVNIGDLDIYKLASVGLSIVRVDVTHWAGDRFVVHWGSKPPIQKEEVIIPPGSVAIGISAKGDNIDVFWKRVKRELERTGRDSF